MYISCVALALCCDHLSSQQRRLIYIVTNYDSAFVIKSSFQSRKYHKELPELEFLRDW
jgi:hypothetical protein